MKNKLVLSLAIAATLFISCGEDDTADIIITDNSVTNTNTGVTTTDAVLLTGNYTEDLTLEIGTEYVLDGPVIMESGTTITIPAGMTVKANTGTEVYLAIAQGAKIMAEGTSTAPIVFTSNATTPNAGDWGGVILLGNAPINSVDGVTTTTATSEIANLPYGGSDEADNSGLLSYVRVEYSGGKVDGQSENNGFSFYGVGNGTTVEYIQVFEGLDDGLEFYGGVVDVNYVSVINVDDDSIDWTEGYKGKITNTYIKQNIDGDKAFECDGYNTDIGNNASPVFFSAPEVTNVTIQGIGAATDKEAIRLRAGTQGLFDNVHIIGYGEAFDLDGDTADNPTGQGVLDDTLQATNVNFEDVTIQVKNDTGVTFTDADFVTENTTATGTDYATWGAGWTRE